MSLETAVGTPLNRRPTVPKLEESDLIEHPKEVRQRGNNWCWAASIETARRTIGKGTRVQHLIVADKLGCSRPRCCTRPTHSKCDKTIDRTELEALWRREGFSRMTYCQKPIKFDVVKQEIKEGRLVLLELDNRHVILVYGWEVDSMNVQHVYVLDTAYNAPGVWPFKDLDLYDSGRWGGQWTGTGLGIVYDGPKTFELC